MARLPHAPHLLAVSLSVLTTATARAQQMAAAAPTRPRGLVVGTSLESDSNATVTSVVVPRYFLGLKLPAFYAGAEVSYERAEADVPVMAGTEVQTANELVIEPLLQLPLLHGGGGKLEGYLQAGVGYGHVWENFNPQQAISPVTKPAASLGGGTDLVFVEVGSGARWFFDPAFALGGILGFRFTDFEGPGSPNVSINLFTNYVGLTATAIF